MLLKGNQVQQKAFTLAETIIYLAIFGVIIISLFSAAVWVYRFNGKMQIVREDTNSGRQALEIISYEARSAQEIYASTTNASQLSLKTAHYLSTGETASFIDFFQCGARLCLKTESTPEPIPITSDSLVVSSLVFQRIAAGSAASSLQISLTLEHQHSSAQAEDSFKVSFVTAVSLRHQ